MMASGKESSISGGGEGKDSTKICTGPHVASIFCLAAHQPMASDGED